MADNLDEIIERYNNIWEDIKNGGLPEALPEIDKDRQIKKLTSDIAHSFSVSGNDALKYKLDMMHKVIKHAHYIRNMCNIGADPIQHLRGLFNDN